MNVLGIIRLLLGAGLLLAAVLAAAQTEVTRPNGVSLDSLQTSLDIIEQGLEREPLNNEEIARIREQVEFVAGSAVRIRATAERKVREQTRLLDALGSAPAEGEPPETQRVEEKRESLQALISEHRGRAKSANVLLARADALRERLVREEFSVLADILRQRTASPLTLGLLSRAASEVGPHAAYFGERLTEWWTTLDFNRKRFDTLTWWLVMLIVVVSVVVPVRNWVLRRYGPDHRDESPSFPRRFRVMLAVGLGNVVLPVVSIVGLYVVFLKSAAPSPDVYQMVWILTFTLCQYFLIIGLSAAALSPKFPNWRISRFTNASAVSLYRGIRLFASLVVVLNLAWIPLAGPQGTRPLVNVLVMDVAQGPLLTVFGALAVLIVAGSMLNILRRSNWIFVHVDEEDQSTTSEPSKLVRGLFMVANLGLVVSIVAALIGYVNLGVFLSQRIVWSLLLVSFAYLLRAFIDGLCGQLAGEDSEISPLLSNTLAYTRSGAARLMFWVMLAVDVVVSVSVIVLLMLIWGVHATDILNVAAKLFYGISIGDYTLSLIDIGVALGLFVLLFIGIRLFQGFLSNRVLAETIPDVGVRDALTTGIGYAGVIVAAIIAISSLGLELSQLAIILGALSVGIGFGLQNVVNNFVSGLILLLQRPIKAGDWIVVGQHEGYVKKINVVATEIQTFDNAELIVPNSQLVSSEVVNWTHKSTVARVVISVGVSYDSEPRRVHDVLLACAENADDVMNTPAPTVVLREFGDSSLVFELRLFIRQADYMLLIGSELRHAITDAFHKEGIVIPYPQRDIHIKSPDQAGGEPDTPTAPASRGDATASRELENNDREVPVDGEAD